MIEINIKKIPTGKWRENCYVLNNSKKETIIIDPGAEENIIDKYIEQCKLKVVAILNTHGHYDHVGAVQYLKDKFNVPFLIGLSDKYLLKTANLYVKLFDGSDHIQIPSVDYYYDQLNLKDVIEGFNIEVIYTPGHTQGSVCLLFDDYLFTGDTLLKGKIGRTDLPGGDHHVLKKSLKIVRNFPNKTMIFPGHGSSSTIGNELGNINKFINPS